MSTEVLQFAKLLAPIPGDKPTGSDLRADSSPSSLYYAVKDARSAARAAERQIVPGEEPDPTKVPDWRPVQQNAIKVLAEKSKDLEMTAYLIEALVRLHGFAGLRDGLRLARELVEKYWDGLFPAPDAEGVSTRVAPLTGLNGDDSPGTLMDPIARVPITEQTSFGRFNSLDYHQATSVKKIADPKVRDKKIADGALAPDRFEKAVAESTPKFYHALVKDLTDCGAELTKLGSALDSRCGPDSPPTSAIRAVIDATLMIVKDVARAKLAETPAKVEPAAKTGGASAATAPAATPEGIETREGAFRSLMQVADFFRRTEPHSMISYALDQVVRWGRMPLPDLLAELIPEEAVRKNLFKQVGIRAQEPAKPEPAKK